MKGYLSASLVVTMSADRPGELVTLMGESHRVSGPRRIFGLDDGDWVYEVAWELPLVLEADPHPGTEGLSRALEGLSDELAERVNAAVSAGCSATLSVVQELTERDDFTPGIHLTAGAISWLSRAGASIGVDQYVFEAPS